MNKLVLKYGITALLLGALSACGSSGNVTTTSSSTPRPSPSPGQDPKPGPSTEVSFNLNEDTTGAQLEALLSQHLANADINAQFSDKNYASDQPLFPKLDSLQSPELASFTYTDKKGRAGELTGQLLAYKQKHSAIVYDYHLTTSGIFSDKSAAQTSSLVAILGTPTAVLPTTGEAIDYTGQAFGFNDTGNLAYTVNFAKQTAEGSLYGFSNGTPDLELKKITLSNKAQFDEFSGAGGNNGQVAIAGPGGGTPISGLNYAVLFYGPNAAEIVGRVQNNGAQVDWLKNDSELSFAGKRSTP